MVVVGVISEQPFQMAFIHRDYMIEQVSPAAFDPSFRHAILPGAFKGGSGGVHSRGFHGHADRDPIFGIMVENQISGYRLEWKRLPQLLHNLWTCQMPGNVEVHNASAVMVDHKEAIEQAEGGCRKREEIHRRDAIPMVVEKGKPALTGIRGPWGSFHPAGNRSLGDIEPEHEKFSVDARRAPSRVLSNHAKDEIPYLFGCLSSPHSPPDSRNGPPIQPKTSSVPADRGFGRDDEEALPPTRPDSPGNDPEEPVESAQSRPWLTPFQHDKLLA